MKTWYQNRRMKWKKIVSVTGGFLFAGFPGHCPGHPPRTFSPPSSHYPAHPVPSALSVWVHYGADIPSHPKHLLAAPNPPPWGVSLGLRVKSLVIPCLGPWVPPGLWAPGVPWSDSHLTLVLFILGTGASRWRPGVPYQAQGAAQEELHPHERAAHGAGTCQRGREASRDAG